MAFRLTFRWPVTGLPEKCLNRSTRLRTCSPRPGLNLVGFVLSAAGTDSHGSSVESLCVAGCLCNEQSLCRSYFPLKCVAYGNRPALEIQNLVGGLLQNFVKPYSKGVIFRSSTGWQTAQSSHLALAMRTIVGTPAGEDDAPNRRSANQAGLPGAHINMVLELEEARLAVGIDVIGD
jgi:hypothetical protein